MKKMRETFGALATLALMAGAPVGMTSCDDDDVKQILEIIDLFTSSDELNNTGWSYMKTANGAEYISMYIYFENGQVLFMDENDCDENGEVIRQTGTYKLDTNSNLLVLTLDTGTRTYTITEYTKGKTMTLTSGSNTYNMVYDVD